jgi:GH15 family glucan-1,4-alpha-glucosidase
MCWVAFDRAIKDAVRLGYEAPLDQWLRLREQIHADVCAHGYDSQRNCFVQAYGSPQLDASLLLIPVLGFLPARDNRVIGTIAAIERELVFDGLVRRYDNATTDDGLPGRDTAFLACSFWLVDAYAMCGRRQDAEELFTRLLSLTNDVGLLSEEYDPAARRMLGNFPQAFSHLSLVASAFNLSHDERPSQQRSANP